MTSTILSVCSLHPNDYNPNSMTEETDGVYRRTHPDFCLFVVVNALTTIHGNRCISG